MNPLACTTELAAELARLEPDLQLLTGLRATAHAVQATVPGCLALSVTWHDRDLTFTLAATEGELDRLNVLQRPPVAWRPAGDTSPLDEHAWRAAAHGSTSPDVASTLTLTQSSRGRAVVSTYLYAATATAFDGHHHHLAAIVGADPAAAVTNADLPFATRADAEAGPQRLRDHDTTHVAVGVLASALDMSLASAAELLHTTATEAGVAPAQFARTVIETYTVPPAGGPQAA